MDTKTGNQTFDKLAVIASFLGTIVTVVYFSMEIMNKLNDDKTDSCTIE